MASSVSLQPWICGRGGSIQVNAGSSKRKRGRSSRVVTKCSGHEEGLEAEIERVLSSDKELFDKLNAAVERVEAARKAMKVNEELERKAQEELVEKYEYEYAAAEAEFKAAELALVRAQAGQANNVNESVERLESGRAAIISALAGSLAALPLTLSHGGFSLQTLLTEGAVLLSCAAFGVTYRYTIRRDVDNFQLKAGCVAAFAMARGLGQVDIHSDPFELATSLGQDVIIFLAAALALDACIKSGYLHTFPSSTTGEKR